MDSRQARKIAFIDRDGTLIEEPDDQQVDRFDKFNFLPGVVSALQRLVAHGYELVLVSNQDGLGTPAFPHADFDGPQQLMLRLFASQGIEFSAIHIDRSRPEENRETRKPGLGMLRSYLHAGVLDTATSCVIGDRESDMELGRRLGVRGLRVGSQGQSWAEAVSSLLQRDRRSAIHRCTRETDVDVWVNLDRSSQPDVHSGIGFLDHMLAQLAVHGDFALQLKCQGDLEVDSHHSVEDCALALGEAMDQALGDRRGIGRFGFVLPMDEVRCEASVDLSGRPGCYLSAQFTRDRVGALDTQMVGHFFRSFSQGLRATIHLSVSAGNCHHMVESAFKTLGRALRPALVRDGINLPSSKGIL